MEVVSPQRRFAWFAWFVIAYNIGVILWGAYVRATGSGAGCGEHWPLCNGEIVPRAAQTATVIEFTHRLTSGLAGLFAIVLPLWARRVFPAGHVVRKAALWSLILTVTEGLLGASLVLLGHVAENRSAWRGVSLSVHLINTLFLLAALSFTAWYATARRPYDSASLRKFRRPFRLAAAAVIFAGVTGAIAALGDTLFRSESLAEGLQQDLSASSHIFLRLRLLHPFAAVLAAVILIVVTLRLSAQALQHPRLRSLSMLVMAGVIAQLCIGLVNLLLLAPVWLQLIHLLAADVLWISFILLWADLRHDRENAVI
jgi:heme A synthase